MEANKGLEALAALASAAPSSEVFNNENAAATMQTTTQPAAQSNMIVDTRNASAPACDTTIAAAPHPSAALLAAAGTTSAAPTPDQWSQNLLGNTLNAAGITAQSLALIAGIQQQQQLQQQQQQQQQTDPNLLAMQQQIAYYQFLSQIQSGKLNLATPQLATANATAGTTDISKAAQAIIEASKTLSTKTPHQAHAALTGAQNETQASHAPAPTSATPGTTMQVLPTVPLAAATATQPTATAAGSTTVSKAMPPPPQATVTNTTISSPQTQRATAKAIIAPQPHLGVDATLLDDTHAGFGGNQETKKLQKRAANRRSAQLSRKRKKQFIEELKDENDELRRKEQILRSIPDLIVVFDSSGKLWFVSESVSRFMKFTAEELEGTSFWERLCVDSVRLLKAAFMDSLAARQPESDTAALGSGFWELRLVDKDGAQRVVTLNGVVHFAGDRPECVCSVRPREEVVVAEKNSSSSSKVSDDKASSETATTAESSQNEATTTSTTTTTSSSQIRVMPHQSVIGSGRQDDNRGVKQIIAAANSGKSREAVRISDSGNGSSESDSGSSDEMCARA